MPNATYSFPESGFPPFLEPGPVQLLVPTSANPAVLPNPAGNQHIQFSQQMCVFLGGIGGIVTHLFSMVSLFVSTRQFGRELVRLITLIILEKFLNNMI